VIVRAAVDGSPAALGWIARLDEDVRGYAPELVWIEVANALNRYVQAQEIPEARAAEVLETVTRLPLNISRLQPMALSALRAAVRLHLSVYDACYVVLAQSLRATLVTADRQLASVFAAAELIR
jgi:predicted nucleic acid-binding protein